MVYLPFFFRVGRSNLFILFKTWVLLVIDVFLGRVYSPEKHLVPSQQLYENIPDLTEGVKMSVDYTHRANG